MSDRHQGYGWSMFAEESRDVAGVLARSRVVVHNEKGKLRNVVHGSPSSNDDSPQIEQSKVYLGYIFFRDRAVDGAAWLARNMNNVACAEDRRWSVIGGSGIVQIDRFQ